MIRLKVHYIGDLRRYLPIDAAVTKEVIESVDVDLGLLEAFFADLRNKREASWLFGTIKDKYTYKKIGQIIGVITVEYEEYTKMVNYLEYLCYEPFNNENI